MTHMIFKGHTADTAPYFDFLMIVIGYSLVLRGRFCVLRTFDFLSRWFKKNSQKEN